MDDRDFSRLQGDEGSALVEFALVLPLLVWLFLGVFEYGTAWRNSTVVASALRTTVRSVAQARKAPAADMYALQGLMASLQTTRGVTVDKVIVYNGAASVASGTTIGQPLAACKNASTSLAAPAGCNVYRGTVELTATNLQASNFGTVSGCSGMYDANWCPSTRVNSLSVPNGPEWVGVYISVTYDSVTNMLPDTITMSDYTSSRLEPPTV